MKLVLFFFSRCGQSWRFVHDSSGDLAKNRAAAPNNGTSAASDNLAAGTDQRPHHHHSDVRTYRVAIIGAHGVGKSALVGQFMSSECINAYDRVKNGKPQREKWCW